MVLFAFQTRHHAQTGRQTLRVPALLAVCVRRVFVWVAQLSHAFLSYVAFSRKERWSATRYYGMILSVGLVRWLPRVEQRSCRPAAKGALDTAAHVLNHIIIANKLMVGMSRTQGRVRPGARNPLLSILTGTVSFSGITCVLIVRRKEESARDATLRQQT